MYVYRREVQTLPWHRGLVYLPRCANRYVDMHMCVCMMYVYRRDAMAQGTSILAEMRKQICGYAHVCVCVCMINVYRREAMVQGTSMLAEMCKQTC
jgi:hypothetical protein